MKLYIWSTALALLVLSGCSGEPFIDSRAIVLTENDFPHEMSQLRIEPLSNEFDLWTFALHRDEKVRKDFDNGTYTRHLLLFAWRDRRGNVIYRKDCGGDPTMEQSCTYVPAADTYVLSFKSFEGAKRAFQILAETRKAVVDPEHSHPQGKENYILPASAMNQECLIPQCETR